MTNNESKNNTIQKLDIESKSPKNGLKRLALWIIMAWTLLLAGLLYWDLTKLTSASQNLAINEARIHFQKDKVFRYWSAIHGGFYVPISERTTPSPYLSHILERDIQTPAGKKLTLMNPAWALRQMNEEYTEMFGIVGHITSLLPLRAENSPDDWETKALELFESGEKEVYEFIESGDNSSLRLMQPLITAEGCLKCHGHQGYKVGDVRGGVSVSVPLDVYLTQKQRVSKTHKISYALLWLIGFLVVINRYSVAKKNRIEREKARMLLQESYDNLEDKVQERTIALFSEKEFSEKLITTSTAIIVGLDKDHLIKIFNDGAENITGYKKDEVIGKDWFKMFFPDDMLDEMNKVWKDAWRASLSSYTNPILIKSGEERTISWQSSKMYEGDKKKDNFLISIGEDITERNEAREITLHLNRVLRTIRNVNQLIVEEKNKDVLINKICKILTTDSGYNNAWIVLFDKERKYVSSAESGLDKIFAPMEKMLKKGKLTKCGNETLAKNDIIVIANPENYCSDCPLSKNYEGRGAYSISIKHQNIIYGLLTVSIDKKYLTDDYEQGLFKEIAGDIGLAMYGDELNKRRKEAEKTLKSREGNLRDLVGNLMDGVAITDEDANFIFCNRRFSEITGYSRDELLKITGWDITREEDKAELQQRMKDRMSGKPIKNIYERIILKKDGTEVFVEVSTATTIWEGKKCPLVIVHDITERKQSEEKMISRNRELETFNKITVGRELKMLELKKEINELFEKSGKKPKYKIPI